MPSHPLAIQSGCQEDSRQGHSGLLAVTGRTRCSSEDRSLRQRRGLRRRTTDSQSTSCTRPVGRMNATDPLESIHQGCATQHPLAGSLSPAYPGVVPNGTPAICRDCIRVNNLLNRWEGSHAGIAVGPLLSCYGTTAAIAPTSKEGIAPSPISRSYPLDPRRSPDLQAPNT